MRLTKAKEFTYNNIPCLKIGDIEEYRTSFEKFRDEGKNWILTRTCAYMFRFVAGPDMETGVVKYAKVPTVSRCNLNYGFHKFMTWDEIKDYIANDFKVWSVEFETIDEAQEEEYNARHDGDMNSVITGGLNGFKANLLIESDDLSDKMIPQWFNDRAQLRFMDRTDTRKLFHPA